VNTEHRIAALISAEHPSLPGHFPGAPMVPGVVMLERVVAAIRAASGEATISGMPAVKLLRPLLPGQAFEIVLEQAGVSQWKFRCESADGLLAQGSVSLA